MEWYDPLIAWKNPYDLVYMSKVFTFTPDYEHPVNAGKIIRGGTGYDYPNGGEVLLEEVEHMSDEKRKVRTQGFRYFTRHL